MTMDKSLRIRAGSTRSRNVLTRAERIEQLKGSDRFADETNSPYGLPKTRVVKLSMKKKKKVKEEEGDDKDKKGAKPAAGAKAPAAAAKPAAGAKKGTRTFDNATALRLLAAHRDSAARQRAISSNEDSEAIIQSINAKLEVIRQRRLAAPAAEQVIDVEPRTA